METYSSKLIADILNTITPEDQAKVDKKMLLAVKIADGIKAKNWKPKDLLAALGKDTPSLVTKWLSGTHNFTTDTLMDLERVLNIRLLDIGEIKPAVTNIKISINSHSQRTQTPKHRPDILEKDSKDLSYKFSLSLDQNKTISNHIS